MSVDAITLEPHPDASIDAFWTQFPQAIGTLACPDWLLALLARDAPAPFRSDDAIRAAVRDMLRHGGYKPTGRGKPASEYLVNAAATEPLRSINAAVDVGNAVSLHTGLPISVVDLDRATPPFRVGLAPTGSRYVFNAAGQDIDVEGLLCLSDAEGACANAVKDAQRTKTTPDTVRTLTIVWGARRTGDLVQRAAVWYRGLLAQLGASSQPVQLQRAGAHLP